MSSETIKFVINLARKYPVLEPLLFEHKKDLGEILPHLLIADYCRAVQKGPKENWKTDFLTYLERHFGEEDDPVSNLIGVSFVENLYSDEPEQHWTVDELGSKMKQQYERVYGPET